MGLFDKKIKYINTIFGSQNFYPFLCAYSNNDVNTVIDNLSRIINYVLTTEEDTTGLSIETLLEKAAVYSKEGEFLIFSTNSYLDNIIRLTGLNPDLAYRGINKDLTKFYHEVTFLDYGKDNYFPLYGSVKKAIEEGFTQPKSLYQGILKQPVTYKRPVIVGESEVEYYNSILQSRIPNATAAYRKTGAATAKKVLKEVIGKSITLYFIPPDKETDRKSLTLKIPTRELSCIKIPSYYTLLMTCAKNKKLAEGTKLSFDTGAEYQRVEPTPKQYSSLTYSRFELIPINDEFEYSNEELTGDVSYDMDTLYSKHDPKDNRSLVQNTMLDDRLRSIKEKFDINLILRDGKYEISNGRHRIVFLKHYYESNRPPSRNPSYEKYLQDQTTIIANVDHTFEDERVNQYLIFFEQQFRQVQYLKTNCNNDDVDLIITCGNHAYHIPSREDLFRFVKLMRKEEYKNEYFIGYNSNYEEVPYNKVISKLSILLGPKIYRMNLMDIVKYLKRNKLLIDGQEVHLQNINYERLYIMFTSIIQYERLNRLRGIMSQNTKGDLSMYEIYYEGQRKK